jgi:hypothetical protein
MRRGSNGSRRIDFGSTTIERYQYREVGGALPHDRKKALGVAQPTAGASLLVGLAQRKPTKARKQLGAFAIHEDDNSAMSDSIVLRGKMVPT